MPAKSKKQRMAAGIALSAKRHKREVSSLRGPSRSMFESMNERQLKEFAAAERTVKTINKRKAA